MSLFAFDTLGFHPAYPGHPCTLALLILRKYPHNESAHVPLPGHSCPAALSDVDIPGAGGAVYKALDLIRHVRKGTLTPDAAIQWGIDGWREDRLGGDHRDRYPEGVAEEAKVVPLLREALAKVAPTSGSAAAHKG